MFRFTIRDLLWLLVVVAMACAWQVERQAWESQRKELLPRIAELEEIEKMLGSEKAFSDFMKEARAYSSRPPRPTRAVVIPVKPEDRILKSKPPLRPRNES